MWWDKKKPKEVTFEEEYIAEQENRIKKPKTIYRQLSKANIKRLAKGYSIAIQVNGQRVSLKGRA